MVYGYIRVSTDKQDCENQKTGIFYKAQTLGLSIDKYIMDSGISGVVEPNNRALGGVLKKLKSGDIIICSEISRLGRKLFMIMRILEHCMKCGAYVYTVKDGYELGDNIQSKVLAFAFGISAEIERDLISMRTREALTHKRACGIQLGRRKGSTNKHHKIDNHEKSILQMINSGVPKTKIAKKFKISAPTLYTFLRKQNRKHQTTV